jgi:hypothetical protein
MPLIRLPAQRASERWTHSDLRRTAVHDAGGAGEDWRDPRRRSGRGRVRPLPCMRAEGWPRFLSVQFEHQVHLVRCAVRGYRNASWEAPALTCERHPANKEVRAGPVSGVSCLCLISPVPHTWQVCTVAAATQFGVPGVAGVRQPAVCGHGAIHHRAVGDATSHHQGERIESNSPGGGLGKSRRTGGAEGMWARRTQ